MSKGETWKKWKKNNVTTVHVYMNNEHDADILDALEQARKDGEPKIAAMKRWARIGISVDNERKK